MDLVMFLVLLSAKFLFMIWTVKSNGIVYKLFAFISILLSITLDVVLSKFCLAHMVIMWSYVFTLNLSKKK